MPAALDDKKDARSDETSKSLFDVALSPEEKKIVEHLHIEPLSASDLGDKTDLPPSFLNVFLSELELKGIVSERSGLYRLGR
jgi:predicted Rossmann fold nucleotide-binding protein DprA/Smf involved in DNA uptake